MSRRLPIGAEPLPGEGASFRIWAPNAQQLSVILNQNLASPYAMQAEKDGYWSVFIPAAMAGDRYQFRINADEHLYPDPASRYQPEGPHGPSVVVNPSAYAWTDGEWPGITSPRQVIYEMHIGTFTREGTYQAAARELKELAALGITTIEVMPLGEFDGSMGWGYDVVGFYAPYHGYGTPEDLRALINTAHAHGIAVILDVVYNHFGPSGAYHHIFSAQYYSDRYAVDWGETINYDGPDSAAVREYVISNAIYWIGEFHFDGLRIDATHFTCDASPVHIISEIVTHARKTAGGKTLYIIGENESQQKMAIDPVSQGGYGLDAVWNDDFHHAANVALRGKKEAYLHDYRGNAQELVSLAKWGYLYQGQYYAWQKKNRGSPVLEKKPANFIHYLQNHDQIANSGVGKRLHQLVKPGEFRAMTTLLLLAPQTPLLFQGQEFAASTPFIFFADHAPDLAASVENGRFDFLSQFPSLKSPASQAFISRPEMYGTFEKCKLDFTERERHADIYLLHRELLALRHNDPVFSNPCGVDGAVLSDMAFVLRFFAGIPETDRLLVINLGKDLSLESIAEPLFAPPADHQWQLSWASEHPKYGGDGIREVDLQKSFVVSAASALVFTAAPTQTEASI